ncbi:tRNA uracil 4-sulfurtransferase ThiI [Paenibacillus sp. FSL M8-0228]|uniref:Probable tRNA sulfurtransferase n=1 Tax=Paenibacillus polymyxa TaxID=1406 RepID=A0A8I1IV09_PAEPO|nr:MULTISPECIES: tRNA uracil 4-sulfurtransferase ThiI [Paenibacillus]KAF6572336.1 tRNA 4-thiouridine(8) synthase ThiI [Paenibacillus sp. EKM206P]KAF6586747.1 tRNA 4-thiouridine(8) synthase ThiI [Paenibacillus sp. EKM205P]MBM0634987.1 tRNA 4-thiouridine(8) synthase ThiI [Paenibacillus polymyxa]MBO3286398.1 tRNA 4-thiouridine(8) synthase ThiI [Paenibacillus polymyxa]ODB59072.1 tRNA 4-thiouridine(8) synthase ThiI [Paenibacillus polymyxa]
MHYDMLLLRFGEFTLKGKNRTRFEKAVLNHVKLLLKPFPGASLRKEFGRIYVVLGGEPYEQIIQVLQKVFGITTISPVKMAPVELGAIIETAVALMRELNVAEGTTFKVNARRVWKEFAHSSQEMNHLIGSPILREFQALRVDVHQPDIELRVEVREQAAYIFSDVIMAVGGFPLGTNGKAMLLLSGGIDSPVAGWSSMRRGLEIECVHFYSYPFTSERAKEKVIELARVLAGYAGRIKIHLVPFTEVQTAFTRTGQDNLIITLMRRSMLRIATMLAEREGALALVTGDSLGQVASQTLSSMNVIGRSTELPLLRPLVMMDKQEITEIAKQIGTYDLSILPYEDCCTLFVPKSPTTNPNLWVVQKIEASIRDLNALIEQAVAATETLVLEAGGAIEGRNEEVIQEDWF